jgi:hypothetical protein
MYTKMLFYYWCINTDSPLSSNRVKFENSNCEISGFHSVVVSLVGRFEDFSLPTSETSRKTSTLKVCINICSA